MTDNPDDYPGLEPAQAFVLPSYQWMLVRIEAADSRLQSLVTSVLTVTAAIPAVGRALYPSISFDSGWLTGAITLGVLVVILGLYFRSHGAVMLADPKKVYDQWLHFPPYEFQKRALCFAGKHFQTNRDLVNLKSRAMTALTILFAGELGLLLMWLRCA